MKFGYTRISFPYSLLYLPTTPKREKKDLLFLFWGKNYVTSRVKRIMKNWKRLNKTKLYILSVSYFLCSYLNVLPPDEEESKSLNSRPGSTHKLRSRNRIHMFLTVDTSDGTNKTNQILIASRKSLRQHVHYGKMFIYRVDFMCTPLPTLRSQTINR